MRFKMESDVEAFREEIRAFIAKELPAASERPDPGKPGASEEYKAYVQGFQRKLAAKKWLAMAWPKEYGGYGASHMHQMVYNEEMAYADAPSMNMGVAWVGPSLMLYGTEEQKNHVIPRDYERGRLVVHALQRAGIWFGPGKPSDPRGA